MIKAVAMFAVGSVFVYGGVAEVVRWILARRRLVRTTATIVGSHQPGGVDPGSRGYAAVFEFTTQDGHVVRTSSSVYTFPGPKVGRRVVVTYDPTDPLYTTERPGARAVKLVLAPLVAGVGGFVVWLGTTYL